MAIVVAHLGQVEPRERVGAQTGRRYEYQYERTARASLNLLADEPKHICVYCDWHDDYVVEVGDPSTSYEFHQVKARKSSQGPWTFRDFFGLSNTKAKQTSKNPKAIATDAIFPRMLVHRKNFQDSCTGLAFVTNSGLDVPLSSFLEEVGKCSSEEELSLDAQKTLQHIACSYTAADPILTPSVGELFAGIRSLKVYTDQGQLENSDAALLELADIVERFSEIDLLQRQAKQIAREVIGKVRQKVAHSTTVVPASIETLRSDKGVVINDLLNILSLSSQGYDQLRTGTSIGAVKTLSRLQRYCSKHGMDQHIVQICEFKTGWDLWRTAERHFLKSADYILLEQTTSNLLKSDLTIDKMVKEAKEIAKQFSNSTSTPLTPEHVVGLMFSLAAQSEAHNSTSLGDV